MKAANSRSLAMRISMRALRTSGRITQRDRRQINDLAGGAGIPAEPGTQFGNCGLLLGAQLLAYLGKYLAGGLDMDPVSLGQRPSRDALGLDLGLRPHLRAGRCGRCFTTVIDLPSAASPSAPPVIAVVDVGGDKFAFAERIGAGVVGGMVGKVRPIVGRTEHPQPAAT